MNGLHHANTGERRQDLGVGVIPIGLPPFLRAAIRDYSLTERQVIKRAWEFAVEKHTGQKRRSGEPYVLHPAAVATILADMALDFTCIAGGLLHDIIEDCPGNEDSLRELFGDDIYALVEGVTKIPALKRTSKQQSQAEEFRRVVLAMSRDPRILLIKLADRLHNMRTLSGNPPAARKRIAQETFDLYVPIAGRLGLHDLRAELDEHAFRWLHPFRYTVLGRAITKTAGGYPEIIEQTGTVLAQRHIRPQFMSVREKTPASLYRKMRDRSKRFVEILDVVGVRIIVDEEEDCYRTLGALHKAWRPFPGGFKDYIAAPKSNGYQSLHTSVLGHHGRPVEYQIRTSAMHAEAERGIAAHWIYKDGGVSDGVTDRVRRGLRDILSIHGDEHDSREFISLIKIDLFPDEVRTFTPTGDIITLPKQAVALDFAYAIHTDLGDHAKRFFINGVERPAWFHLSDGDTVRVETSTDVSPLPAALDFVTSGRAQSHLRKLFRETLTKEANDRGRHLVGTALLARGRSDGDIDPTWTKRYARAENDTIEHIYTLVGSGERDPIIVADAILLGAHKGNHKHPPIPISGTEPRLEIASCCSPLPGDAIVGLADGGTFYVHRDDCIHQHGTSTPTVWWGTPLRDFPINYRIEARNAPGVLAIISGIFDDFTANIDDILLDGKQGSVTIIIVKTCVRSRAHCDAILDALNAVPVIRKTSLGWR